MHLTDTDDNAANLPHFGWHRPMVIPSIDPIGSGNVYIVGLEARERSQSYEVSRYHRRMSPDNARFGRLLLAVAAESEARAILSACDADPRWAQTQWLAHRLADDRDLVVTGIGKANAAGAVSRVAASTEYSLIISLGVAGALPGSALNIGDAVVAVRSVFADEGLVTPERFEPMSELGFAPAPGLTDQSVPSDTEAAGAYLSLSGAAAGPIATVSTCSGTDERAAEIVARTGALAEAMEGAAVGLVAHRFGIRFAEVRLISNTTGLRSDQVWDLPAALAGLRGVLGR